MPTTHDNRGSSGTQDLIHRTLASLRAQPGQASAQPFVALALAAGRDALQSAGPGWYPESDLDASAHAGQSLLLEFHGFKRISLRVNAAMLAERAGALQSAASADPLSIMATATRSMVRLYAAHYDICPLDLWRHRRLVDAASWGAYRVCYPTEAEFRIASSIAAFFEKSIVACHLTRAEGARFVSGLAMERALNPHPPQHFLWALFQRTQSVLFPDEWEQSKAFKISPLAPDPAADAILADVVSILFRARVRSVRGRLRLRGKIRCPAPWEWSESVEWLAELLAPCLKQRAGPEPPVPNPFLSRGSAGGIPGLPGLPGVDPGDAANPFLNSGQPNHHGDAPYSAGGGAAPGRAQGRGIGCTVEQIDDYYTRQAQSLQVKDDADERGEEEPEMLPIGFLDHAPATLRDLATGQIDWFRTRRSPATDADPTGRLQFRRLTEPLEVPAIAFDPGERNVPNLLLLVDSSSSMNFNPHGAGAARGKYDVVLMACWGLFRFLKERRLEDSVWLNAINFSGATRISGWHRGNVLPVKRVLAVYEGGGTTLGTAAVRAALEKAPGRFVAIIVTDGSLGNTAAALEELRRTVEAGNHLVLLHIGTPNAFTAGVKLLGGTVHILNQARELVGLCLNLAKVHYADAV